MWSGLLPQALVDHIFPGHRKRIKVLKLITVFPSSYAIAQDFGVSDRERPKGGQGGGCER